MRFRKVTPEVRAEIVAGLHAENPIRAVADAVGVSKTTVYRVAQEEGIRLDRSRTAAATRASTADFAARRALLAQNLVADAERLRAQLYEPCVEKKTHVVSHGQGQGSSVEIVVVEHDEPTFADKQRIMTSVGIAVDKVAVLDRLDGGEDGAAKGLLEQLVDSLAQQTQ